MGCADALSSALARTNRAMLSSRDAKGKYQRHTDMHGHHVLLCQFLHGGSYVRRRSAEVLDMRKGEVERHLDVRPVGGVKEVCIVHIASVMER